ncbi:MAG: hypothetical protein JXB36_19705 [Gammaproteobacteria bacterium]|nr:hypothetical protein [Gammaproteobacteria bacterium]
MKSLLSALSLPVILAVASGCSTTHQLQPSRTVSHTVGAGYQEPVFLSPLTVSIPRENLDRYACLHGDPLICNCRGRIASSCDCRCPR